MGVVGFTAAILLWPDAQTLLKFGSIGWTDMALAAGLGALLLALLESGKAIIHHIASRRPQMAAPRRSPPSGA